MRENNNLPTYSIQSWHPTTGIRFHGDANGIASAESMVETLLREGEAAELEIVLDGRCVEDGRWDTNALDVTWRVMGRRRDLR